MMETLEIGRSVAEKAIAHYGVKGMKWGVRKKRLDGPEDVMVKTAPGKRVKATGGRANPVAEDAIEAARLRQRAKRSTTDSLSNQELQRVITRMQLEDSYDKLIKSEVRIGKGKRLARRILGSVNDDNAVALVSVGLAKGGKKPLTEDGAKSVRLGASVVKGIIGAKKK